MAQIGAANANQSAMLRAQEDAAWRQRQAAAMQAAAGIAQGAGQQYGQQAQANMQAGLQNQAQNDQASLGYLGYGATAMGQGVAQSLASQQLQNQINQAQSGGYQAQDDRMLRAWAAQQGYDLQQAQMNAQQNAATMGAIGAIGGGLIGAYAGGPAGAAVGSQMGGQAGRSLA
jgi:hypothetical protein